MEDCFKFYWCVYLCNANTNILKLDEFLWFLLYRFTATLETKGKLAVHSLKDTSHEIPSDSAVMSEPFRTDLVLLEEDRFMLEHVL